MWGGPPGPRGIPQSRQRPARGPAADEGVRPTLGLWNSRELCRTATLTVLLLRTSGRGRVCVRITAWMELGQDGLVQGKLAGCVGGASGALVGSG